MKRLMHLLSLLLCVGVLCSVGAAFVLPASAADGITLTISGVTETQFTATISFPAVNWKGFNLRLQFDPNAVQVKSTAKKEVFTSSADASVFINTVSSGSTSEIRMTAFLNDPAEDTSSSGTKFQLVFQKKGETTESATISLLVFSFIDNANNPLISYTSGAVYSTRTATFAKPPASDTSSSHSTDTEPITNTDTNVSTSSGGNSDPVTDTSSTDTKTSTRPTVTDSDSNTNTKTSSSDTDTDTHSDTDTQSETSSDSNVTDQPTEPSLTDQPIDPPITSAAPGTTVPVSSALPTDEPEKPKTVSAGALVGISLGVAAALCGVFVFFGYRRRRA